MTDSELRQLEREVATTNDPVLVEKLDNLRQRSGLPSLFDDLLERQSAINQEMSKRGPLLLEQKMKQLLDQHKEVVDSISWSQTNEYNDESYSFNYGHIKFEFVTNVADLIEEVNPYTDVNFRDAQHVSEDWGDYYLDVLLEGGNTQEYPNDPDKGEQDAIVDKLCPELAGKIHAAIEALQAFDDQLENMDDALELMFGRDIRISMGPTRKIEKAGDHSGY